VSATPPPDLAGLPAFDDPVELPDATIAAFRRDGHAVVRGLAQGDELPAYRDAVEAAVTRRQGKLPPLAERDAYSQAFVQLPNLWRRDAVIARFVLAARFAKAAADLMGVDGVRIYHDQALAKEAGGAHTPWHQDQVYWPLDTDDTITMWMPLVDVPMVAGPMTFASGSHRLGALDALVIGEASDAAFSELVADRGLLQTTHGPFVAGDATFHRGWTLHRADANDTDRLRLVMTVIYYADGARIGAVDSPARELDHEYWLGGIPPGELADDPHNPVVWPPAPPEVTAS
jgi:ectoine hydroxylase-related dioxygenase (phytanoyl-CoA dioxygenase family)